MIKLFTAIALAIFNAFYLGWALSILWGWFIVQFGVIAITPFQGAGIMIVAAVFKMHARKVEIDIEHAIVATILSAPTLLGVGWIIKQITG